MTTVIYVAQASGDDANGYTARVPDLPGCEASGPNLGDLLANAREAVLARLHALEAEGEEWPRPTPLTQVSGAPGLIPFLVDVQVDDTPVRVNISIGEQLLKRLDSAAESRGLTRSGFIAQAVRGALGERRGVYGSPELEAATRKLQEELTAMGRKISDSLGPDSAFTRSMSGWDERVTESVRKAADQVSAAMARRKTAQARTGAAGGPEPHAPSDEAAAI